MNRPIQYGGYTGYQRPEPTYADWYGTDLAGINWGGLGQGYTGAARLPGSANPTGRFNWETPGSGLIFSQLSNAQAAQDFNRGAWLYGQPGFEGADNAPFQSGLGAAALGRTPGSGVTSLPNGQSYASNVSPQAAELIARTNPGYAQYYDPETQRLYLRTPQNNNQYIAEALEMGYSLDQLRNMGPAQSAAVFDDVIRMREQQNQLPKRMGPLGTLLPLVTGLAFGPMAGGVVGGAFNAGQGNIPGALASGLGGFVGQNILNGARGLSTIGPSILGGNGGLPGMINTLPQWLQNVIEGIPRSVTDAGNIGLGALGAGETVRDLLSQWRTQQNPSGGTTQDTGQRSPLAPLIAGVTPVNQPTQIPTVSAPPKPRNLSAAFLQPLPLVRDPSRLDVMKRLNTMFEELGLNA